MQPFQFKTSRREAKDKLLHRIGVKERESMDVDFELLYVFNFQVCHDPVKEKN